MDVPYSQKHDDTRSSRGLD